VSLLFVWYCLTEYKTAAEVMATRLTAKRRAVGHVEPSTGAMFLGDAGHDSDEHVCCKMKRNLMSTDSTPLFWQQDSLNTTRGSKAARL